MCGEGSAVRFFAAVGRLAVTCAVIALALPAPRAFADKAVAWKSMDALFRMDDHPVADWALYQTGKGMDPDPVLLSLNGRFLFIQRREHRIYEIPPDKIEHRGEELWWDPADRPAKPLQTTDWNDKDIGVGWRIVVRLVTENHLLDMQLPHPLDIRSIVR